MSEHFFQYFRRRNDWRIEKIQKIQKIQKIAYENFEKLAEKNFAEKIFRKKKTKLQKKLR